MLAVSWDTIRLFLHVLAATVWVGGQLTLAALVPALRRFGAEVPRAGARHTTIRPRPPVLPETGHRPARTASHRRGGQPGDHEGFFTACPI